MKYGIWDGIIKDWSVQSGDRLTIINLSTLLGEFGCERIEHVIGAIK